jgi:hypothetical protein
MKDGRGTFPSDHGNQEPAGLYPEVLVNPDRNRPFVPRFTGAHVRNRRPVRLSRRSP